MSTAVEGRTRGFSRYAIPLAVAALLIAFAVQCVDTARENSLANDEAKHLVTGWWFLERGECCRGIDNSPATAWFALPLLAFDLVLDVDPDAVPDAHREGRALLFSAPDPERVLLAARLMSIAAGVAMLLGAFVLSRRLFGPAGGLVTTALLAFEPNLVAHFSLVSTDSLFAAGAVIYAATLDRFFCRPGVIRACWAGATLGIALITKFTALALVPATLALLVLYRDRVRVVPIVRLLLLGSAPALVAALVVWLGYGAHGLGRFPFLAAPGLVEGIAQVGGLVRYGFMGYYFGEVGQHWPTYFLGCLALKTPLPELMIWAAALCAGLLAVARTSLGRELTPLVLAAVFLAVGLTSNLNIGVRHILCVYVFMGVAAGALTTVALRWPSRPVVATALGVLLVASAVESGRYVPNTLSYFNQLAGGPSGGLRYLGDSNLDWGQDLKALKRVMTERGIDEVILSYLGTTDPEFYGIRYQHLPPTFYPSDNPDHVVDARSEILAVSASNIQGIVPTESGFAWLRGRTPLATAGYSIYLYDITGDGDAHAHLAQAYTAHGRVALASIHRDKAIRYGAEPHDLNR